MTEKETALGRRPGGQGGERTATGEVASSMGSVTPIRVGVKVVGEVRGGAFVKTVKSSKHMLRKPLGWALDLDSLQAVKDLGARYVELHDADTRRVYSAPIATIEAKGITFDRGWGRQVALGLEYWTVAGSAVRQERLL